jgi:ribonucleoside-diphosphate reductase alpha chain
VGTFAAILNPGQISLVAADGQTSVLWSDCSFGDDASLRLAADVMREICHAAYRASIELAKERGAFPAFAAGPYLESPFVAALPGDIRAGIAAKGIRSSHLTAIAPAGSISLLANNVSSGLEPVFAVDYRRAIRDRDGSLHFEDAVDYAVHAYRTVTDAATHVPPALVTAADVDPEHQLAMQAALQPYVDNASPRR